MIGSTIRNGRTITFPRCSVIPPTPDFKGDIEQSGLAAGQGVGNIDEIPSAGEPARSMTREATGVLERLSVKEQAV